MTDRLAREAPALTAQRLDAVRKALDAGAVPLACRLVRTVATTRWQARQIRDELAEIGPSINRAELRGLCERWLQLLAECDMAEVLEAHGINAGLIKETVGLAAKEAPDEWAGVQRTAPQAAETYGCDPAHLTVYTLIVSWLAIATKQRELGTTSAVTAADIAVVAEACHDFRRKYITDKEEGEMPEPKRIQYVRTHGGKLALIRPMAERLLREGVISGTLDGDLHADDPATVKAAILGASVCDFCSVPGAAHYYDVPDFGVSKTGINWSATRETGGWMACDICHDLIQKNQRDRVLDRAIETMAFPKFTRRAIAELYAKFWQGMDDKAEAAGIAAVLGDFVEDRLQVSERVRFEPVPELRDRSRRVDTVMRLANLTRREAEAITEGKVGHEVVTKLVEWQRTFGPGGVPKQAMTELLRKGSLPQPPPPASLVPHWQRALEEKLRTAESLLEVMRETGKRGFYTPDPTDLNDMNKVRQVAERARVAANVEEMDYQTDVKLLRAAESYSFGEDPILAITDAAKLIPHESPLSSIDVPTGAGWFWFSRPLPVPSSAIASEQTQALLWGWVDGEGGVAMRFSAYVSDDKNALKGDHGRVYPSVRWYWPLSMSFHEMVAESRLHYRADVERGRMLSNATAMSEDDTLHAIGTLSLFFLAACMWFKQKVLVQAPGHVERHARKRLQKEHKLAEPPTVRVIALRAALKREPAPGEPEHAAGTGHKLTVRYVVSGHPRLQRYGPGLKEVKLIWIAPFVKGPEGAPFRSRQKVFAVIR